MATTEVRILAIVGSSGRMGSEVARLADAAGLPRTEDVDAASVIVLALPHDAAREHLSELAGRSVIDLSGAVKRDGTGVYGLVESPAPGIWYGNPGCMAMGGILGVQHSGAHLDGPLHISAVGGASYAPRNQTGTMRIANRTLSHPHVAEIEQALGASVGSFVPVISYGTERGLVVTVSARGTVAPSGAAFDVESVVGTPGLLLRAEQHGEHLTLTVGLDNLTLPASNAVRLARSLLDAP